VTRGSRATRSQATAGSSARRKRDRRAATVLGILLSTVAVALAVSVASAAGPRREVVPLRLRQLIAGARLVVAGRVEQVESLDSGRLAVSTIAVSQTLKGEAPPGRVQVLDLASLPSTPPLLRSGESVLLFLGPARRTSYVRKLVADGSSFEPLSGREGVVAAGDPAAIEEAARLVAALVEASRAPEPDLDKRRASERTHVFAELAARHPTVVEDGIAGLADLKPLLPLSDEERARLAATIARDDLSARVRDRLFAQVASLQLEAMVPALQAVQSSDPEVTAAAWSALRRLGAAPDAKQIAQLLRATSADVRIAAARELIARDPAGEVDRAARLAVDDPDAKVRVAVSDALGQSGSPATIVVLEKAFGKPPLEAEQAAARAIFQIGGRPAQESFARLTFTSTPEMQRYAVTLLRASGIAEDDPLLVKIRKEHPEAEVRETAEHGFPKPEH
jgi:hypothetical protein